MKNKMKLILVSLLCLLLLAPEIADAKAGGGGSMGSRGGRTFQSVPSYNAAPIQRSYTPPPVARPQVAPAPAPAAAPVMQQPVINNGGGGFWHGVAGGLVGAGIGSMLFGHGGGFMGGGYGDPGYGGGYGGGGSLFGGLLQLLIIGGIIYFGYRWWRNRSSSGSQSFTMPSAQPLQSPWQQMQSQPVEQGVALVLNDADYQSFRDLLEKIQLSWGKSDLSHLRQYVTPEMMQYFNETLSANSSKGLMNVIEQVRVTGCNLAESWSEADLNYATVEMEWQAIDFMARLDRQASDADYVSEGSAHEAVMAKELWTFARARSGGHWLLSAIQQID